MSGYAAVLPGEDWKCPEKAEHLSGNFVGAGREDHS
jgi:hypothetical protein